jgi:hypothetical protein
MHERSFEHCIGNVHSPVSELHMAVRVPHRPQVCGLGRGAAHICIEQVVDQRQFAPHTCSPLEPHSCVDLGSHWPSPVHVDQLARPVFGSHVLVCMPQLPHARAAGSAQT